MVKVVRSFSVDEDVVSRFKSFPSVNLSALVNAYLLDYIDWVEGKNKLVSKRSFKKIIKNGVAR